MKNDPVFLEISVDRLTEKTKKKSRGVTSIQTGQKGLVS
jgi:hypothetical protein